MRVAAITQLVLAGLAAGPLLYAGVSKLLGSESATEGLRRLQLRIPARKSSVVILGVVECTVGTVTITLSDEWIPAAACVVLYLLFAAVLERARRAGAEGDCGCFGALSAKIDAAAVVRNVLFAAIAIALLGARISSAGLGYDQWLGVAASVLVALASGVIDTLVTIRRTTIS